MVRRRYLGDTVLMQPFVANLRRRWSDAWISMVVDTPYAPVMADVEELDEVLELPVGRLGLHRHASRWLRLLRAVVARGPWDLAFDFARNERAQLLALLSRAPVRLTYELGGAPLHRRWPYTHVVAVSAADREVLHTVDMNNLLLQAVGVPTPFRVPRLPVRSERRRAARGLLTGSPVWRDARLDGPLVVVHPGSGAEARRWPPERFARVADHLARRHGARVVVLGGPAESGLAGRVTAAMAMPGRYVPAPADVRDLAGLLAEADLLLCNDSGPMHIAAAVGTPVCALYGAQSRVQWAPLGGADDRTLQPSLPCGAACVAAEVCVPRDPMHAHCIRRIEVSDVIRAVDAQMAARHLGAAAPATAATDEAPGEADDPGEADAPVESDAPVDTTDEAAHAGR
ncbi:MAG: glycosyltransferase family 9 protein [Gemmatimonadota bacterium]